MIELNNITKRYGSNYAVRQLSFSATRGQIIGLLGQNGAGKTTTLNILTGYLPPTDGTAKIGEYDIMSHPRQAKRLLGYLPERPPLYDEMTVEGYLRFVCQLKEVTRGDIAGHVTQIINTTGLKEVAKRLSGHLSKGYRQRLGIAGALCGAPEVLVLDEPTIGLDPRQVVEIRNLIKQLGQAHTLLFSSHILSEVQQLCSRVIILHEGRLLRDVDMLALSREDKPLRLRVSIAMKEKALIPALRSIEGVARVTALPTQDINITEAILECAPGQDIRPRLFTLLSGLDAPILRLNPLEETLEEIFLNATENAAS